MSELARVVQVEHLGGRVLRVVFSDDLVRELDFEGVLVGVLSGLDADDVFSAASVDPVAGTVTWPGGLDLDPDVLHGDYEQADGRTIRVMREYKLQSAG